LHPRVNCLAFYDCVFTLYCATLRECHFFPTRRSSDLQPATPPQYGARVSPSAGRIFDDIIDRRGDQLFVPAANIITARVVRPHEDRKSTRLNSSHVSISYAVFCLKKKSLRSLSGPFYQ